MPGGLNSPLKPERRRERERERAREPFWLKSTRRFPLGGPAVRSSRPVGWTSLRLSGGRLESYAEAAGSQLPPQVSLAKSKPEIGPASLKWVARK